MCTLMVGLLCIMMLSGSFGIGAKLNISKRVMVILAGEKVSFDINVTIPMNRSASNVLCYGPLETKEIQRWPITSSQEKITLNMVLTAHNSSFSGEYKCTFLKAVAYTALLVKDEGFQQLSANKMSYFIVLGVLITGLIIFNVVGSIYVFRSQMGPFNFKKRNSEETEKQKRPKEVQEKDDKTPVNATASASVYASLVVRPSSVYEVAVPVAAKCGSGKRKSDTKKKGSKKSMENTPQGDGIVECVYENF
ncbi:hypothetical protein UPYG_G00064600 [Umbra pygmaea]|uniref:Uncharacterized protein n=1 Tax=Umbra pygmaea TaxID=75934 RepID=A0ABD0XD43_UMBPY